jgi:hypothetical protein
MELPTMVTPAVKDALSLMLWETGPIAHVFREAGADIPRRAEDEQAYVLLWALKLAIEYGTDWRKVGWASIESARIRIAEAKASIVNQAAV